MSFPKIPGFTSDENRGLSSLWAPPPGNYPSKLWPKNQLKSIEPNPAGWVRVEEHYHDENGHGGRGCVLISSEVTDVALSDTSWIGRDLGEFASWTSPDGDAGYEDGLAVNEQGLEVNFLIQVRNPPGSKTPQIDVSLPFLWFWDAFKVPDGWRYLSAAGRDHDLIRYEISGDSWWVEIRAQELRTFMAATRQSAVMQVDYVTCVAERNFNRVDDDFNAPWALLNFHAVPDQVKGSSLPSIGRFVGQYIIAGQNTPRQPRWVEFNRSEEFADFIYGVDPDSGSELRHSCDPNLLGSYFDADDGRLHYLTPIYFRRDVLQDYVAQPSRYEVTPFRLSCLNLWGVEISINTAGLIEVYLGDIGSKIPAEEWGHWRKYNVPPEGKMEEGRFRRDFLNQWAASDDPIGKMKAARDRVNMAADEVLGDQLWRPLPVDVSNQYRSLMGPLTNDSAALHGPILIIAKVFVDGLNSKFLKRLSKNPDKGDSSLALLKGVLSSLGDTEDSSKILRDVYAVRSRGGVAHLSNSASSRALSELGIDGGAPADDFRSIVERITSALDSMEKLIRMPTARAALGMED